MTVSKAVYQGKSKTTKSTCLFSLDVVLGYFVTMRFNILQRFNCKPEKSSSDSLSHS